MSFLDNVVAATARRQSEYFVPGNYLVEVLDVKLSKTRKGRECIIVETKVLDSHDLAAHPTGSERTWLQMTDNDMAPKNFKLFVSKALNVPAERLDVKQIEKTLEPQKGTGRSVLAGVRIEVQAKSIKTKAGSDFTLMDFISVAQDKEKLQG